jgi:RNA polymerase sigma-70 factor, ECF subfamily
MSVPDADLVRLAQHGDLDAYEALVARHRASLQRYAFHLLGNREEAEEALQDSLLRCYRAIGQCAEPARFRAWLLQILINRCRSRLVRQDPQVHGGEADSALQQAAVPPSSERSAWLDEIRRALARLPGDQREAFLLHHVEEWSYDEMAELTGASVPALKMRVSRACDRLRSLLEEVYRG